MNRSTKIATAVSLASGLILLTVLAGPAVSQQERLGERESIKRFMLEDRIAGAKKTRLSSLGAGHFRQAFLNRVDRPKVPTDGSVVASKIGAISKRTGSVQVANMANGTANASCEEGEVRLNGGGGFLGGEMNAQISFSGDTANVWRVHGRNESGAPRTLEAQVHCLEVG